MEHNDFSIFHPDIFRYRTSYNQGNLFNEISFSDVITMSNSDELFASYRIGQLFESLLLYDKVYIELTELPIVMHLVGSRYYDALTEVITNGTLRIVNKEETIVTSTRDGFLYSLGVASSPYTRYINNDSELDELLHRPGWTQNRYSHLARPLFDNAKCLNRDIAKIIIDGIKQDLKNEELKKRLGLITKNPYKYAKNDAIIMNRLAESYLRTSVCSELGISNIFFDDILLDVIKIKSENFVDISDKQYREGFLKVIETKNVPNIPQLYIENRISLDDIIELKNSSGYEVFREWLKGEVLLESEKDFSQITGDLINEVERRSIGLSSNKFIKGIRLAISILIGVKFSPAIGIAHSAIDSLLIDYFLQQKSPKLFLDDYTKIVK